MLARGRCGFHCKVKNGRSAHRILPGFDVFDTLFVMIPVVRELWRDISDLVQDTLMLQSVLWVGWRAWTVFVRSWMNKLIWLFCSLAIIHLAIKRAASATKNFKRLDKWPPIIMTTSEAARKAGLHDPGRLYGKVRSIFIHSRRRHYHLPYRSWPSLWSRYTSLGSPQCSSSSSNALPATAARRQGHPASQVYQAWEAFLEVRPRGQHVWKHLCGWAHELLLAWILMMLRQKQRGCSWHGGLGGPWQVPAGRGR